MFGIAPGASHRNSPLAPTVSSASAASGVAQHPRRQRLLVHFLAALTFVCLVGQSAHAQLYRGGQNARELITQPIQNEKLVTLVGNTHPSAIAAFDRGALAEETPMEHMQLVLQRPAELEQALGKLMDEQQRKGSPNYHKWLTAEQFATRYGIAQHDVEQVSNWLRSQGFRVDSVLPTGMAIEFSGNAGQVKQAFHTEVHHLMVDGEPHIANMTEPQIPAALAPLVLGVHALHDFKPHSLMKKADPALTTNTAYGTFYAVAPADLATIYNLNPAFSAGNAGSGQTIVVIEDTLMTTPGDISTFRSAFGLSGYAGSFSQGLVTGAVTCNNPGVNGAEGEAALDAEWAGASAPDAKVQLAACADTTTVFGGLIALQNLINSATPPPIVSISYGECEAFMGATANASYVTAYQQAAAEGISVFVSSGDEGAASCDANATRAIHGIAVSGFTSTPYNVSVGGTDFGDTYESLKGSPAVPLSTYWSTPNTTSFGSALSYIPEIPWNDSCASALIYTAEGYTQSYGSSGFCNSATGKSYFRTTASGSGGPSSYSAKPNWQSVWGNPGDGHRDIPDVSLFAANGTWSHFLVYCLSDTAEGGTTCDYSNPTNVLNLAAGGTSFSSPILAGIQALINQKQGGPQGNPNPVYYGLANLEYGASGSSVCNSSLGTGESSSCIFNDVTLGDIDLNCTGPNCFGASGATQGALSTSATTFSPAYGTNSGWDFATGLGSVNAYNLIQNYGGLATTTVVTSSSSSTALGQSVTYTATVSQPFGNPVVGTITWSGNTGCASSTLVSNVATCTTSSLGAGNDTVTATFNTDAAYLYKTSVGNIQQTVSQAVPTETLVSTSNPYTFTGSAAITVTVTGVAGIQPTGSITFLVNRAVQPSTPFIDGQATLLLTGLAPGSYMISAYYSGDANYQGSVAKLPETVTKISSTASLVPSATPIMVGTQLTLNYAVAEVSGVVPNGTVRITDAGVTIATLPAPGGVASWQSSSLTVGKHTFAATYYGDADYSAPVATAVVTVTPPPSTTTTLTSSLSPAPIGSGIAFTANVIGSTGIPTGTVSFYFGKTLLAQVPLTPIGAQILVSTLPAGSDKISAVYSGDGNDAASTGTFTQVVSKLPANATLSASPNPAPLGSTLTLTFTVPTVGSMVPGGSVVLYAGSTKLGSFAVSNGVATYNTSTLAAGAYTFTAEYSGDANYAAAKITATGRVSK